MNRIKVDKRGFQIGYYCNCSHSNLTEYIPVKARHGRCIYCKHYAVYGNYKHKVGIEIKSDNYRKRVENSKIYLENLPTHCIIKDVEEFNDNFII